MIARAAALRVRERLQWWQWEYRYRVYKRADRKAFRRECASIKERWARGGIWWECRGCGYRYWSTEDMTQWWGPVWSDEIGHSPGHAMTESDFMGCYGDCTANLSVTLRAGDAAP